MSDFKFKFDVGTSRNKICSSAICRTNIPTGDDVILPMKSDAMNTANEECDIDHCNTSEQPLAAYEVSCVPYFKWEVFEDMRKLEHVFSDWILWTMATNDIEEALIEMSSNGGDLCHSVLSAIASSTDLVAGCYEGGLKVWECTYDLCHFILESQLPILGSVVLDLGCGSGLSGVLAAKLGASEVHFQDFNCDVLRTYTMATVHINNVDKSMCRFFAGDWSSFYRLPTLVDIKYDVILSSETIYSVSSYSKLLAVFTSLLKDTGVIIIAAKSEYFGVGGGVGLFLNYVQRASNHFTVEVAGSVNAAWCTLRSGSGDTATTLLRQSDGGVVMSVHPFTIVRHVTPLMPLATDQRHDLST